MTVYSAKDPNDISDFSLDWTDQLGGDTITVLNAVTITPATTPPLAIALNAGVERKEHTATTTRVWLTGGKRDTTYLLDFNVTTAGGRTFSRHASVPVRDV